MNFKPFVDTPTSCDLAIIGAGASGLAAAIFAGDASQGSGASIVLIESAKKPGAKILISGGGRCNVTNESVSEKDFWGGSPHTVRKVLSAFSHRDTVEWFGRMGVPLKREPSGKLFPTTDRAQTVLSALLSCGHRLGITLMSGWRVVGIEPIGPGFSLEMKSSLETYQTLRARRVIVASGGLALPKSGSDGAGLSMMQGLGHTIIPTTPALTPLILSAGPSIGGRFAEFRGITIDARLRLCPGQAAKPLTEIDGSLVFTHFGISGPVAMNFSRHWLRARLEHPETPWRVLLGVPEFRTVAQADSWLKDTIRAYPRRLVRTALEEYCAARLAQAIAAEIGERTTAAQLTREDRLWLADQLVQTPLKVIGTRGYSHAEATAGGVDLREVEWRTMESRRVPGVHLCGEILDVDGRIGGFNFQWAWSSGYLAGRGAAQSLIRS